MLSEKESTTDKTVEKRFFTDTLYRPHFFFVQELQNPKFTGSNLTYGNEPNTVMTVASDSHRIPYYPTAYDVGTVNRKILNFLYYIIIKTQSQDMTIIFYDLNLK